MLLGLSLDDRSDPLYSRFASAGCSLSQSRIPGDTFQPGGASSRNMPVNSAREATVSTSTGWDVPGANSAGLFHLATCGLWNTNSRGERCFCLAYSEPSERNPTAPESKIKQQRGSDSGLIGAIHTAFLIGGDRRRPSSRSLFLGEASFERNQGTPTPARLPSTAFHHQVVVQPRRPVSF